MRRLPTSAALVVATLSAAPAGAQSLVAHYELNESSGTMCFDSSPNAIHGTYRNGFTLGGAGSAPGCGTSVAFDDTQLTDVLIQGAPPLDSMTSDLTVAAWINPNAIPSPNSVDRIFGNNNGGWMCGLWGDGLIFTTRFIKDYLMPGAGITAGTWTHVAFVFDASFTVTFYVNGTSIGFEPGPGPSNFPNPEWFIGGFDGNIEFWNGSLDDIQVYQGALSATQVMTLAQAGCGTLGGPGTIGTNYCGPAVVNASGAAAAMSASGSSAAALNNLTLECTSMPTSSFSFFITSQTQGFVAMPGTSAGNLCLGGSIGRFVGPGQIQNSGGSGSVQLLIDLTQQPTPTGLVVVLPGDTWSFQCWFRDLQGGAPTSNFSDGLEIDFV